MASPTLVAYEPLSEQGLYARTFIENLTGKYEGYTHTIRAVGGYDKAAFVLKGDRAYLEEWYADGLMRRIAYYNPEGITSWEGFVSRMSFTYGTLTRTKTVDGMANRILLSYSPLNTSTTPPTANPVTTIRVNDLDNQAKYGIKTILRKAGERTDEEAYALAMVELRERARPQTGETVNTLSKTAPSLKIECLGYYYVLDWLHYEADLTGTLPAHQVVQEIMTFFNDVNQGWLSMNFGLMDYNFREEKRGSDELKTCWENVEGVISRGGLSGERWVGGFYQDRVFQYKPAEDFQGLYQEFLTFKRALADPAQRIIEEATDMEIQPWDVLPDRILKTTDL